jgi:hypothetical protein
MHVADHIYVEAFEVEVGGEQVSPEAVFPDWSLLDRFGIIVAEPLGGLGASLLQSSYRTRCHAGPIPR